MTSLNLRRGNSASLGERVLRHFGAEPSGVGKVRGRRGMPDGQVTDQFWAKCQVETSPPSRLCGQ